MRVALLLSGIVGNMYTRKAFYEWEGHVDFRIGHHFFKKHIIDVNDQVDVFMHCWDMQFEKELVELYKPKKSKFEKQIMFDEMQIRRHYIMSRWYSAKKVTELKREYEKENSFKYDVVMSSRFDIGIFKDLNFNDIDNFDAMYIPDDTVNKKGSILDYWYFSSSENMDKINNLYDWANEKTFESPHKDLYIWTSVYNGIDIYVLTEFQESELGNGDTEVIRLYFENCEYKPEFVGIDNLRRVKKYPTGTGRLAR